MMSRLFAESEFLMIKVTLIKLRGKFGLYKDWKFELQRLYTSLNCHDIREITWCHVVISYDTFYDISIENRYAPIEYSWSKWRLPLYCRNMVKHRCSTPNLTLLCWTSWSVCSYDLTASMSSHSVLCQYCRHVCMIMSTWWRHHPYVCQYLVWLL